MHSKSVLIVDDEKNIRLTLSQALETLGLKAETAASGEEGLAKLKMQSFGLLLLDLKMPGMDGMEVLRQIRELRPDIRVIIITAYGTIESAVEAIKLGAVDFIQKPFAPQEIRELVLRIMDRDKIDEKKVVDYATTMELAKRCIGERHFDAAVEHVRKAIFLDPSRPEAFNLMGALMEIRRDFDEARKHYRAATSLDPTYEPARKNLERITSYHREGSIILGEVRQDPEDSEKNAATVMGRKPNQPS
jgi:FixJ family two-component response regulator